MLYLLPRESGSMDIDFELIGERIRNERKKRGLTQEDLSYQIDMSVVYLSRIERGTSSINLKRLAQISTVLDVPLEKFITGVNTYSGHYLDKDLYSILTQCSPTKQRLIYNIAKIVLSSKIA